ncbi:hypothetical protein TpMuguga_02g00857 [Theileria parva strain Muguga]|uniref:Uncharacterized protein n=1 Tax=Theileria parva TaxID=5875 RepID=Q4N3Y1_THEPA|nr:uncharacterized protein TpMuguga_02g00857 [Theileria parva strain Muguga]EAN33142.1 hypothetical protein TpMuguga_02g00857 [Theileria parva strain Muguga]|eukprot:XP_765425.1 hypothetical protein [Theileria parva strain Muguga]
MKIVIIFIAVLLCPYKPAHGAGGVNSSQSSGGNSLRNPGGAQTTNSGASSGTTTPKAQATGGSNPGAATTTQSSTSRSGTTTTAKSGGSSANKITLDIKKTNGTKDYECRNYGDSIVFTPKPGHGFSKIVKGSKNIWTAQDGEYATRVVLKGKGSPKKEVSICLNTDTVIKLRRDGKNKPWIDINSQNNDTNPNANTGSATVDPSNASATGGLPSTGHTVHSSATRAQENSSGRTPEDSSRR